MSQGNRVRRVEEMVQRVISEKLISEVDVPQVARITLVDVEMTPDLKQAKVFFSIMADTEQEKQVIFKGLVDQKKQFRMIVGRELDLKFTPELIFKIDETAERAARIEELIQHIRNTEQI